MPESAPRLHAGPARPSRSTLYVANISNSGGDLFGYALHSLKLVYMTTSDLKEPAGLATDSVGAVYVANTYGENILKYMPPATTPALTIDDSGFRPTGVAIDSKGDIWVTNGRRTPSGLGNVVEFDGKGKRLHTIFCPHLVYYAFLAVDGKDDVIVDAEVDSSEYSNAGEIAAGTTSCTLLPAIHTGNPPGGVEFTKTGEVTVIDQLDAKMRTYAKPTFSHLIATTPMNGVPYAAEDAFEPGDQYFWASVPGDSGVFQFAYPSGGKPTNSIGGISFPTGVAITTAK